MPLIDELNAALAAADDDVLPVSQNRATRKVTRAQLLAGMQPQLALGAGQLLGRSSNGTGAPEAVSLGQNLVLQGGTLGAVTSALNVPGLPPGGVPAIGDLVPFAQSGRNVAIQYDAFMRGIAGIGGVDGSGLVVTPAGAAVAQPLAAVLSGLVPIEAFGAKGDGVTDDTAAFAAAVASGQPLRLAARTYVLNGQFTIARPGVTMLGVPGLTVLRRGVQAGNGAWIAIQADGFRAEGITFDANGSMVGVESWGVQVGSQCLRSDFHRCTFRNACGAMLGCGLVFQSSDPAVSEHVVRDCAFSGNAAHGLWVQACMGVLVAECRAFANARYGIVVDFNDTSFARKARLAQVVGNRCWGNERGISVGNYNATNLQPPTWGNADPDTIGILVAGNICHDNTIYGIAASGSAIAVQNNVLNSNGVGMPGGGGVLANSAQSLVLGNTITGSAVYGIDCGGSIGIDVGLNNISGAVYGINCGGGDSVRVFRNRIQACTVFAICAANVEADGNGVTFGMATSRLAIEENWIGMDGACGGIWLRDGPSSVLVRGNELVGSGNIGNCLWADTDDVAVQGNRFNFAARPACVPANAGGLQQVVVPDIADAIAISGGSGIVQSMVTSRQAQLAGRIGFVRVAAGGRGYSSATVAFGGSGTGAAAAAIISGGVIIGVRMIAAGNGYGAIGTNVPVTISGDGSGVAATAWVAAPLPAERRVRMRCDAPFRFAASGAAPAQVNWTGADLDIPVGGEVEWVAANGAWQARPETAANLLAGAVRHVAPGESIGCTSAVGRGSPQGVVAAAPGSDWRNLDGGAGSTYWVKQSGTGTTGWVAIA